MAYEASAFPHNYSWNHDPGKIKQYLDVHSAKGFDVVSVAFGEGKFLITLRRPPVAGESEVEPEPFR